MSYISLTGGAYQSRSIIASAQRCLNLYVEPTPQTAAEPLAYTHYPTPGSSLLRQAPQDICRCLYRASNRDLYAVYGTQLFYVQPDGVFIFIGILTPSQPIDIVPKSTPVSMADNGTTAVIVDGSVDGWTIDLASRGQFKRIQAVISATGDITTDSINILNVSDTDGLGAGVLITGPGIDSGTAVASVSGSTVTMTHPATATTTGIPLVFTTGWYGSDFCCYLDTFLIFNKPGTPIFYISGSEAVTFDPEDFASKQTMADSLVAVVSIHAVLVMIGEFSWESWQNTGGDGTAAGSFPFSRLPGNYGNVGCIAKYSIAATSNRVWWLSQDASGRGIIQESNGYDTKRVSTFAIETQISHYPNISDCVAYTYQQQGHTFVVFNFESANDYRGATWVFDATVEQWHERCWIDANGIEWRHRGQCAVEAYGLNLFGDWQNSNLYYFDLTNFTDNGMPIKRLRSFPHQIDVQGNRRVMYSQLIANMQVGSDSAGGSGPPTEIIETNFTADDGTLLQNYFDYQDIGARFTKEGSTDLQIISDAVTSTSSGDASYLASGTPTLPDYVTSFNVEPISYDQVADSGSVVFAIVRANGSDLGYKAQVSSDGDNYSVSLVVMPSATTTIELGTIASGFYRCSLSVSGTLISVAVYRSLDGLWLTSTGDWSGLRATAIQIVDSTYTLPGRVLIGGTWV